MSTYFDSSVLVKIYCREPNSAPAIALIQTEPSALPLTHFQEAELRNTLRLKVFRREISTDEMREAFGNLEQDVMTGRYFRPIYSLLPVFQRAERLSELYTCQTGGRILDILHIAAALEIGSNKFVPLTSASGRSRKRQG